MKDEYASADGTRTRALQNMPAPTAAMPAKALGGAVGAVASTVGGELRDADKLAVAPSAVAEAEPAEFGFTTQTVPFVLPITSGTWILQQDVRVRASALDNEVRLTVANHGAMPILFELRMRRGTNVLRRISLDAGQTTNFVEKTKR
jgi:hypothetical protein